MSQTDFGFDSRGYDLWMQQSNLFFDSVNANFGKAFSSSTIFNPEDHLTAVKQWLDVVKSQFAGASATSAGPSGSQDYWNVLRSMCGDSADMLLEQWIQRTKSANPIKTIRELYELWLECCQSVYQKSLKTDSFQSAYSDWMNAALKMMNPAHR